jgi:hypothetical protein
MKQETTSIIKTIIDACGTNEATRASLKNLLTRIYLNGQTDGLEKAREIFRSVYGSPETINVGSEDHDMEVRIKDVDIKIYEDDLPF